MLKRLFFLTVVVGAIGLPYLASSSNGLWTSISSQFKAPAGEASAAPPAGFATTAGAGNGAFASAPGAAGAVNAAKAPIEGATAGDLGEVLRFDVTPQWVMARWPRVTASLAELDLQGYRVPLVTGTHPDDLAGSLTYYFDRQQHVTRIAFLGTTGDPRKIIGLVTTRYKFVRQQTTDPNLVLFQVKWNGKARSEMRIRAAHVLRANQPLTRYEVELAMSRF
jgi:Family of unknown function (DUF6690)